MSELPWYQMTLGLIVSFTAIFLKGFQQKNLIGDHYKLVIVTGYFTAAIDVVAIGLIVQNGWIMAIPAGTGSAFGMVAAMIVHKKYVKKSATPAATRWHAIARPGKDASR